MLKMNFSSMMGGWWLRSPGGSVSSAAFVSGENGDVYVSGDLVVRVFGVRPALKLNLSSVICHLLI